MTRKTSASTARAKSDVVQMSEKSLCVIGSGLMGAGIAEVAAVSGLGVRLFDPMDGAVDRALQSMDQRLAKRVERGGMTGEQATAALARVRSTSSIEAAADGADYVIEAAIEDLAVKQDIFQRLDSATPESTLLATNTSALPISSIAALMSCPDRTIGMHFFAPVPAMPLCEVVRGYRTSDETVDRALELASALQKTPIVVERDSAGFVTSRLMTVLGQEAIRIVEEGIASAEDVDKACVLGFGHKLGPLATLDISGLDVALHAGRGMHELTGNAAYSPPQLLQRMVAAGDLGQKTGQGFYVYN